MQGYAKTILTQTTFISQISDSEREQFAMFKLNRLK